MTVDVSSNPVAICAWPALQRRIQHLVDVGVQRGRSTAAVGAVGVAAPRLRASDETRGEARQLLCPRA